MIITNAAQEKRYLYDDLCIPGVVQQRTQGQDAHHSRCVGLKSAVRRHISASRLISSCTCLDADIVTRFLEVHKVCFEQQTGSPQRLVRKRILSKVVSRPVELSSTPASKVSPCPDNVNLMDWLH
jgi:hypothetical protein